MPAEWEPHEATWLAWPHEKSDWPGKFAPVPWVYGEVIRQLAADEQVYLLVKDAAAKKQATDVLRKAHVPLKHVHFFLLPTDRTWTRDYCPIFIVSEKGEVGATHWSFNGWGKYANWKKDNAVCGRLKRTLKVPMWQPMADGRHVVLEGGSIDVNGAGLMLTTEECLLSPVQARNPGLERADLERLFVDYLGIRKVLWLGKGIDGDDTHGHIDDLARFVGPRTVVTVVEKNTADPNHVPLQDNLRRLKDMTDADGKRLEVVELPMPAPLSFDKQRLPASYANFYVANGKVLAPTFNDPSDRIALGILADLFPGRKVVGIHAVDLVLGLGTLHCMTQQQPAGVAYR